MEVKGLVPYKDEAATNGHEWKNSEAYQSACEEREELKKQVSLKCEEMAKVIHHLRTTIYEINIMLATTTGESDEAK